MKVESRKFYQILVNSPKNTQGQATIEYALLLVITIAMILVAIANVFKPLQTFLQDYMGTYVACMLSSGELPSIHTENKLKDADAKCSFGKPVEAKASMTGIGGNGQNNGSGDGAGEGNGSGGKNGKNAKQSQSGTNTNGGSGSNDGGSRSGDGAGGYSSYAGSRSRNAGFGNRFGTGSTDSMGDAEGGKVRYVSALEKGRDNFKYNQNLNQRNSSSGIAFALSGMTEEDKKKVERKIQAESKIIPRSQGDEFSTPAKKQILKPPVVSKPKVIEADEPMTFGAYFKYIFIIIIILLIIIIGGGQIFEMSKSMD